MPRLFPQRGGALYVALSVSRWTRFVNDPESKVSRMGGTHVRALFGILAALAIAGCGSTAAKTVTVTTPAKIATSTPATTTGAVSQAAIRAAWKRQDLAECAKSSHPGQCEYAWSKRGWRPLTASEKAAEQAELERDSAEVKAKEAAQAAAGTSCSNGVVVVGIECSPATEVADAYIRDEGGHYTTDEVTVGGRAFTCASDTTADGHFGTVDVHRLRVGHLEVHSHGRGSRIERPRRPHEQTAGERDAAGTLQFAVSPVSGRQSGRDSGIRS